MNKQLSHTLVVNAIMLAIAMFAVMPLVWMLSVSFMGTGQASVEPPPFLPKDFTLEQYRILFKRDGAWRFVLNSTMFATASTFISVLLNSAAGYAFARLQFKGRDRLFKFLLISMLIPGQVSMLPLFLLLKSMGLVNTVWGVLIPSMASIGGIFLMRQAAQGIPKDYFEAARLDGASEWTIFYKIVLPLLKPAVVTLALMSFLGNWNDFMWPLIILTGDELKTLPLALASLSREHVQDSELMMAGAVVTVMPVVLLFLFLQRHFVRGIMAGGVKS